ncbi:hypothetical protein TNCV_1619711 [Trichonephila clavipes]|nr:hypothetical protein TNCV_1619711 [Trichonephila clavipes]
MLPKGTPTVMNLRELNGMIVKREVLMVVGKQPFGEKKSDNFLLGQVPTEGRIGRWDGSRVDLLGKVIPRRAIEDKLSKLVKTSIIVDGRGLGPCVIDSGTGNYCYQERLSSYEYRLKELPRFI